MKTFIEKHKILVLFMLAYWGVCLVMLFKSLDFLYAALSWNVLLAILPVFFINQAVTTIGQKKISWTVFWILLWLFFFPNSVYVVTDFIHIANEKFRWVSNAGPYAPGGGIVYSQDIFIWTKLLVIAMGFFYSIVVGLESVYIFEQMVRKKYSKKIGYASIVSVGLLTGIGVYIGRFLRFNSWDVVFNPLQVLQQVAQVDRFAVQFIVAFSGFVLFCYLLYRSFKEK
ncbi:DUF1361 domain-containing protein [Sporosarcina sp. P29]|uniref:DUF1361 domain-containing protein n=1 Tax=Sporosarcina sp. P29 TaxID=2048252 RepID=UPI000C16EFC0|nr:DUF1361 domain-containing protein [Sporosarcina sp. P29]PIC99582.1 hypothetical protein CSV68_07495 [Sporosarcina sp. P29]